MTVQELIDELQKIKNKTKPVKVWSKWLHEYETDFEVEDDENCVILDD